MQLLGKEFGVLTDEEIFADYYGFVQDSSGKFTYGPFRHFKLHAWLDALLLVFRT